MDWRQLLLNPDQAGLEPLAALSVCVPLIAIGVVGVVKLIARLGPSGGALSTESLFLGAPLAVAALILPEALLYMLFRDAFTQNLHEFVLHRALLQLIVTCAAIYFLRFHNWEMKNAPPRVWTRLEPASLGSTVVVWLITTPLIIVAIVASVAMAQSLGLPIDRQPVLQDLISQRTPASIIGAYALAAVSVPLAEEFAFRVVLFGGLRGLLAGSSARGPGVALAYLISIGVFVAVHGMWRENLLYLAPPLTLLSVALTMLYAHTRSIWPGVMLHALHNALVLTLNYTMG